MKFRKKPVIIEAVKFTGDNWGEISKFMDTIQVYETIPTKEFGTLPRKLLVHTLEGTLTADIGDWIIKGIKGEFYPCKPDIFEATYEEVKAENKFNPQSMDAIVWAKEFMRIFHIRGFGIGESSDWIIDEELMRSWFANAIMAGYDEANRRIDKKGGE